MLTLIELCCKEHDLAQLRFHLGSNKGWKRQGPQIQRLPRRIIFDMISLYEKEKEDFQNCCKAISRTQEIISRKRGLGPVFTARLG